MKIKIRQHDVGVSQDDGWSEMGDWLAELGDDSHTEPPDDDRAEPDCPDDPSAEAHARTDARARTGTRAEAPGEAATTPTAVVTTGPETGPEQLAIRPDPTPEEPPAATQRKQPRPLEEAQCSLCGITHPLGLLVPDGGQGCADVRWYCKDAMSCTKRWTTAHPPGHAQVPAASGDTSEGAG